MFENIRTDIALHNPRHNRAFWHLLIYRFGRWSMGLKITSLRWLLLKLYGVLNLIVSETIIGIFMNRHVRVGKGFHIVHPEGVRIHTNVVIGDRVGVMHGVTIAGNMFPDHVPVIGNDVFIGAKASILGQVKIGDGARVAANSLVIADVPAGTTAIGVPAKILRVPHAMHPGRRDESGLPGRYPTEPARLADATMPPKPSADEPAPLNIGKQSPPGADS